MTETAFTLITAALVLLFAPAPGYLAGRASYKTDKDTPSAIMIGFVAALLVTGVIMGICVVAMSGPVQNHKTNEVKTELQNKARRVTDQAVEAQNVYFKKHGRYTDNPLNLLAISPETANNPDVSFETDNTGELLSIDTVQTKTFSSSGDVSVQVTSELTVRHGTPVPEPTFSTTKKGN